jgi:hypothetical protein
MLNCLANWNMQKTVWGIKCVILLSDKYIMSYISDACRNMIMSSYKVSITFVQF